MTTLAKVAATCWQLMFTHFASGALLDDGENKPNSPRYSIQKYHEWKTECVSYLSSPTTVSVIYFKDKIWSLILASCRATCTHVFSYVSL